MKLGICNELFDAWTFKDTCAAVAGIGYDGRSEERRVGKECRL